MVDDFLKLRKGGLIRLTNIRHDSIPVHLLAESLGLFSRSLVITVCEATDVSLPLTSVTIVTRRIFLAFWNGSLNDDREEMVHVLALVVLVHALSGSQCLHVIFFRSVGMSNGSG